MEYNFIIENAADVADAIMATAQAQMDEVGKTTTEKNFKPSLIR